VILLLDTNFLIDLHSELRKEHATHGPAIRFIKTHKRSAMVISPVSASEYAVGIRSEREARKFLRRFRMVALGRDIALLAARIDRELIGKGRRIGENDTWQAAVAIHFNLTLVSDDSDFDKVDGLARLEYR
jgi:predicted nucleic acid-binding protein